jgi:hypothetical protein
MAPTYIGLRPSSGSLHVSLVTIILILKHSVSFRRNMLWGGVAACPSMACVLRAVQSEMNSRSAQHTTHMPYWDMLPHHRITNYDVILLNVLISI